MLNLWMFLDEHYGEWENDPCVHKNIEAIDSANGRGTEKESDKCI
jgi:hypothetical protein